MKQPTSKLVIFCCLTFTAYVFAQDTRQNDSTRNEGMKSDSRGKLMTVSGKISDNGQMFVRDTDGKNWTIVNPDAVKGHEGHHVKLKANLNADKMEVHVISLKMAMAE
jgi:hypothetical protein